MPHTKNPIFCAIDTKDIDHARALATAIAPHVGGIKLGLEFFTSHGVEGVKQVVAGLSLPLFLDLKFYDIPNTVAQAVASCVRSLDIAILTLHASGGSAMMQAAVAAARQEAAKKNTAAPLIAAVTVLTSMDQQDLSTLGITHSVEQQALELAKLAQKSGCDAVVCSAHELDAIKQHCGADFKTIVPGIRPEGTASNDQQRIMTPKQALAHGADFLVIGRPITQSANPADAAEGILQGLQKAK